MQDNLPTTYSQATQQSTTNLERLLRPLFVALPMAQGVDGALLMAGYKVALEGLSMDAAQAVVARLIKGTWYEEIKFCPRPPELANMVREEERRARDRRAPRFVGLPVLHGFKDLRDVHRQRAIALERSGFMLIAEGVSGEAFVNLCRSRSLPAGALHLFAIDEVWSKTPAPADLRCKLDAIRKREAAGHVEEDYSDEYAERQEMILALPDAKEVRPEQLAHRRAVMEKLAAAAEAANAKVEEDWR